MTVNVLPACLLTQLLVLEVLPHDPGATACAATADLHVLQARSPCTQARTFHACSLMCLWRSSETRSGGDHARTSAYVQDLLLH